MAKLSNRQQQKPISFSNGHFFFFRLSRILFTPIFQFYIIAHFISFSHAQPRILLFSHPLLFIQTILVGPSFYERLQSSQVLSKPFQGPKHNESMANHPFIHSLEGLNIFGKGVYASRIFPYTISP